MSEGEFGTLRGAAKHSRLYRVKRSGAEAAQEEDPVSRHLPVLLPVPPFPVVLPRTGRRASSRGEGSRQGGWRGAEWSGGETRRDGAGKVRWVPRWSRCMIEHRFSNMRGGDSPVLVGGTMLDHCWNEADAAGGRCCGGE